MEKSVEEKAKLVLDSRMQIPLLEYFRARRRDLLEQLLACGDKGFQKQQGRAQEVTDIIKFIESIGR